MDKGQQALETDIKDLLAEVVDQDYHDFQSTVSAVPKIALVMRLQALIDNVKDGKYDNTYVK